MVASVIQPSFAAGEISPTMYGRVDLAKFKVGAALETEDGQVIGTTSLEIPVTHSERLMAMVDRLLQECGRDIEKMDALAVSIGPGSFTGLRVGIATVKGLAARESVRLTLPAGASGIARAIAARAVMRETGLDLRQLALDESLPHRNDRQGRARDRARRPAQQEPIR